eukprot:GFKZ01013297.1.p1 GENE.GFKZ01013297.1~~GFKZ01013297.1.p1  ORF type:complete len:354 (+),score=51.67 GFKZ01013297.1:191-1252(+)
MSRRRPTESDTAAMEDGLPPPSVLDVTNGKRRTPTEKAGRFLRTRPVSSLLLLIAFIFTAVLTFGVGRSVGKTVFSIFRPSGPATLNDASPRGAVGVARMVNSTRNDDQVPHDDGLGADPDHDEDVADDEKGALIDGADDTQGFPLAPDAAKGGAVMDVASGDSPKTCHRKFEPGKLGSDKTLCVTDEFFFDISIGSTPVGTLKIGVFGDVVPKSAANFRALATCTGVFADDKLCFKGDSFHRVVTGFVAQGGSKATGRSIYGPTFREEKEKDHHSFLSHNEKGVVSWAEYPIGSQFFILIRDEAAYLDGNHVVFGLVTEGMDVVDKIHDAPRTGEEPKERVSITNCGDARKR